MRNARLKVLADPRLVAWRNEGRQRRYRIVPGPLREAATQLRALMRKASARLERGER